MSFQDVAVEVLRSVGRPLHYKKITEIAIRRGLLSQVGKTPGLTMGSELNQEARRSDGASVVVRTRPGVFALREWALEVAPIAVVPVLDDEDDFDEDDSIDDKGAGEAPRESAVVAAEEDEGEAFESEERQAGGRRRGRRGRRRGGRSSEGQALEQAPAQAAAQAQDKVAAPAVEPVRVRTRRQPVVAEPEVAVDASLQGLTSRALDVLKGHEKRPMEASELAGMVVDEVTASVHGVAPEALVNSALTFANEARARSRQRPLFAGSGGGAWGLTEWSLSDQAVTQEAELSRIARSLKVQAQERLTAALPKMSRAGLEHLAWSLMERMSGVEPTAGLRLDGGDLLILTGAVGFDEGRVGLLVRFNDAELSASGVEAVGEAIGELGVQSGAVVALGGASAEAMSAAEALVGVKLNILDASALAGQLVRHGVGVLAFEVPVVMTDVALLNELGER